MIAVKIPDKLQARLGVSNVHEILALLDRGISPSAYRAEQNLAAQLREAQSKLVECQERLRAAEDERLRAAEAKPVVAAPQKSFRRATRGYAQHGAPRS